MKSALLASLMSLVALAPALASAEAIQLTPWTVAEEYAPPGSPQWNQEQKLIGELSRLSFHTMRDFTVAFLTDYDQGCPADAWDLSRCYVARSQSGELKGFFIIHRWDDVYGAKWAILHLSFDTDAEGQSVLDQVLNHSPELKGLDIETELSCSVGDIAAMRRILDRVGYGDQTFDKESGRFTARY